MNNIVQEFILYENQISGKEPKLISTDGTKIMKGYCQTQSNFYKYISSLPITNSSHLLKKHIPIFYGEVDLGKEQRIRLIIPSSEGNKAVDEDLRKKDTNKIHQSKLSQWLQHLKKRYQVRNPQNKFILLENLTIGLSEVSAMDIKIGGRTPDKAHKVNFSVDTYGMKLNGIKSIHFDEPSDEKIFQEYFMSKYYLSKVVKDRLDIISHVAFFFYNKGKLQIKLINKAIQQLQQIVFAFKSCHHIRFISSSVYIIFDPSSQLQDVRVKIIDFGRIQQLPSFQVYDQHSCQGIQSLISFLLEIKRNQPKFQKIIQQQQLKIFYEQHRKFVVPSRKVIQYQSSL